MGSTVRELWVKKNVSKRKVYSSTGKYVTLNRRVILVTWVVRRVNCMRLVVVM